MPWYDKLFDALKGSFKDLFKDAVHVHDIGNTYNFHFTINQNDPPIKCEHNDLFINLNSLPADVRKQILSEIVQKDGIPLIDRSSEKTLEDIKRVESSAEVSGVINELREYIPSKDLLILRSALYVKKNFDDKKNIHDQKQDIIYKFGDRGRNITNLCTAGYFESTIIPLLREMKSDPNFSKEKFFNIYNLIIEESGFAVFVSGRMDDAKVEKVIVNKIRSNVKYGVKFVHIHGIGKDNIKKIRKVIPATLKRGIEKKNEDIVGNSIYVKLELDSDLINPLE